MNSVTSVSQFTIVRSMNENQPQNGPNASNIASAWPRFVTAPSLTVISCTKYAAGPKSTRNQMRL